MPASDDAEEQRRLADSVGAAMLIVLDALPPAERVAFVLHDMFNLPFDDIATGRRPLADGGAPAREPRPPPRARRVRRAGGATASANWSTPSSPPRSAAISPRCSPCSIPT